MHLTAKQMELITVIGKGNGEGNPAVTVDQILERVKYVTTKESLQFSFRALVKRGLIVKNPLIKEKRITRASYSITELGKHLAGMHGTKVEPPLSFVFEGEELVSEDIDLNNGEILISAVDSI